MRTAWRIALAAAVAGTAGLRLVGPGPAEAPPPVSAQYKYTGTGSCAASNCHGAKKPAEKPGDPDNTYTIWATKDKHNKAYTTLTKKESAAIVQKMKLAKATEEPRCLVCHALKLSKEQLVPRAKYDVADGVSCDSCHGPAEKWLDGHDKGARGGWPHEKSVSLGMYDTKDVLFRAELCVSCHLEIEADMVAAGHPTMIFELDSFSRNQPPHWKDVKEWFGALAWGTGQAVALREALGQLGQRAKGAGVEKLYQDALNQARGHALVLKPLAAQAAPEFVRPLDDLLASLADGKDRARVAAAAAGATKMAGDLARKVSQARFTRESVTAILKALATDTRAATAAGLRSAEQVAMGVDSLYGAVSAVARFPDAKAIDAALTKLFDELPTDPAAFKPEAFVANLQAVARFLR